MFEQLIGTNLDQTSGSLVIDYLIKVITESVEHQDRTIEDVLHRMKFSVTYLNLSKRMCLDDDYVLSHIQMARELWNSLPAEMSHFSCK
jgi:hypothetical protein